MFLVLKYIKNFMKNYKTQVGAPTHACTYRQFPLPGKTPVRKETLISEPIFKPLLSWPIFQNLKLIPSGGSCAGSKNMSHQMWGGSGAVCWCVWWSAGVLPAPGDLRGGGGKEQAKR